MEGTAEVGEEEAEPIEAVAEGLCEGLELVEEALNVVHMVDDEKACIELAYGVKNFMTYFEQQGQFDYQVGKLAGDVYKNGKACVKFPDDVYEAAKGASALIGSTEAVSLDSVKTTQLAASLPKRKLTESSSATETTTLNNVAEC